MSQAPITPCKLQWMAVEGSETGERNDENDDITGTDTADSDRKVTV